MASNGAPEPGQDEQEIKARVALAAELLLNGLAASGIMLVAVYESGPDLGFIHAGLAKEGHEATHELLEILGAAINESMEE